jgi:hypothetical protein
MVGEIFPEFPWQLWKFSRVPRNFWQDKNNQINFMNWLGTQLGIKNTEDWYNVTFEVT